MRARYASLILVMILSAALAGVFVGVLHRRAPEDLSDPFIIATITIVSIGLTTAWTLVWGVGLALVGIVLKRVSWKLPTWLAIATGAAMGSLTSLALIAGAALLISTEGELAHIVKPAVGLGAVAGVLGAILRKAAST